jgi:Tfp pilus assembly major pilin PilA
MTNNKLALDRQNGMTMIGVILLLIVIAFVGLTVMRVVPMYLNYYQIVKNVEAVKADLRGAEASPEQIKLSLSRRFDIDYIQVIQAKDLKVRKNGGAVLVDIKYEDRRELISNLDIVGKFDNTIQVYP